MPCVCMNLLKMFASRQQLVIRRLRIYRKRAGTTLVFWAMWRLAQYVIHAKGKYVILVVAENIRKVPWTRTFP